MLIDKKTCKTREYQRFCGSGRGRDGEGRAGRAPLHGCDTPTGK